MRLFNRITNQLEMSFRGETVYIYKLRIRAFLEYLHLETGWSAVDQICNDPHKSRTVGAFLTTVTTKYGIPSPSTRNQYLTAIQWFYQYIECEIDLSDLRALDKRTSVPLAVLSEEKARQIIFELRQPHNFTLALMFYCGLTITDIYKSDAAMKIDKPEIIEGMLTGWVSYRNGASSPLIPPSYKKGLYQALTRCVNRLRLYDLGNITPMSFRLGGASRLWGLGHNDPEIMKFLGCSAETLFRYKKRCGLRKED